MEKKNTSFELVGAILFFVTSFFALVGFLTSLPSFFSLIGAGQITAAGVFGRLVSAASIAGLLLCGFFLLTKKRDMTAAVGFLVLGACGVLEFILGFVFHYYHTFDWYGGDYRFSLLAFLPWLLHFAALWLMAFFAASQFMGVVPQGKDLLKKLWFLPGALELATLPVSLIVWLLLKLIVGADWYYLGSFLSLSDILLGVALLFAGLWFAYPEGLPRASFASSAGSSTSSGNNYRTMAIVLLLNLVTLGIYQFYWIYHVTKYLNQVEEEPRQHPGHQVVIAIFLPFYTVYWYYRNAQRLDILAKEEGIDRPIAMPVLVFSIFFQVVALILMQDRINMIAIKRQKARRMQEAQEFLSHTPAAL